MYIFKSIYMLTYVYSRNLGYSYSFAISGKRMQVFSSMRSDSMLAFLVWNPSVFFLLKNVTTTGCLIELLSQPGMITVMVVLVQHIWHVWVNDFTARDDFTKTLHVWPQSDFGVVLDHWYSFVTFWYRICLWNPVWFNNIGGCQNWTRMIWKDDFCHQYGIRLNQWHLKSLCWCINAKKHVTLQYIDIYIYMYKSYMSYIIYT